MTSRRNFITGAAGAMVGASLVSKAGAAAIPEAPVQASAATQPPQHPTSGRPYNPVVTLNGWSLPWRMKDGVKEFHLVAEPVVREIAPGMKANLWGYNGQSPGPTIEVVEGDKVRIFVTNKLPEATTIHWHGQILPNGMDGVAGLVQPAIAPGKTFVYEFVARHAGTFMYHPHSDEMTQMAMGMMGFWVTHPKDPRRQAVDRDFVFLLNAYDIAPGNYTPNVNTMLDFNLWTINSRAFPGTDPMVVRKDDKVRIRMGNLTMTNHPFHIHGHRFEVTGTDGGWIPPSARWPEVTVDIGVGQMRAIEFVADNPGDWAFHCHKSHHTMNAMSHDMPTLIGVDQAGVAQKINDLVPGYMTMGDKGGSMGGMQMPLPENTLPMMAGRGPFGNIEMGGMFTVIKVREGLARGDYRDPGWYRHPAGTVAREWTGAVPEAVDAPAAPAQGEVIGTARRRESSGGHQGH
ncbi:multicopper oxidase family protein [Massilia sp. Root335]|uniref:multicopper oxidase family protein n=1 Tax=Massilia sp. Root335 TaxID=1736517 RepID=UPI0006FFD3B4|nr:copper oxidase [Massilia sp. Root335]KQV37807.1 copper oxidase [Massilia sp. Root335]